MFCETANFFCNTCFIGNCVRNTFKFTNDNIFLKKEIWEFRQNTTERQNTIYVCSTCVRIKRTWDIFVINKTIKNTKLFIAEIRSVVVCLVINNDERQFVMRVYRILQHLYCIMFQSLSKTAQSSYGERNWPLTHTISTIKNVNSLKTFAVWKTTH